MKRLIINADDYGLCESVNRGILECYVHGLVSDLSFIINPDCFGLSVKMLKDAGVDSAGVHFNLTIGKPYHSRTSSLTDNDGNHLTSQDLFIRYITGKLKDNDIYEELKYQFDVLSDSGLKVSHFDSHQNIHLIPQIFKQILKIKENYRLSIPIRRPSEKIVHPLQSKLSNLKRMIILNQLTWLIPKSPHGDHKIQTIGGDFFNNTQSAIVFARVIHQVIKQEQSIFEIAVHPGYYSDTILTYDSYTHAREIEMSFLKSMTKSELKDSVHITSFDRL